MTAPTYTPAELAQLHELWPHAKQADILEALPGRTWSGIRKQAHKLGVVRPALTDRATKYEAWSAEHVQLLRDHYPAHGAAYVAKLVGRNPETVSMRASALGVRRDYLAGPRNNGGAKHRPTADKALKPLAMPVSTRGNTLNTDRTPVATASKQVRIKAEKAAKAKPAGYVSAEQLRALKPSHVGRQAYTNNAHRGMQAAQKAFHAAIKQAIRRRLVALRCRAASKRIFHLAA